MHPIQRHILKILTIEGSVRYKDLKPKEVEGNQFMYHLGIVIEKGYVQKKGTSYSMTMEGKMYADRVELDTFIPREQPKIVTIVYCENKSGEVLLYKRNRSPLRNLVHLPYGKIHMGENTLDAARRELKEKTGVSANLTHVGELYVRVHDGGELIAHILHHIFVGKDPKGAPYKTAHEGGPAFWLKIKDLKKNEMVSDLPKIIDIIKKHKGKFFFEEYDLRLPKGNPQT